MTNHVPLDKEKHANLKVKETGDYTRFTMAGEGFVFV